MLSLSASLDYLVARKHSDFVKLKFLRILKGSPAEELEDAVPVYKQVIDFEKGASIGRNKKQCKMLVPASKKTISARHAVFKPEGVEDCSSNGTFLYLKSHQEQ